MVYFTLEPKKKKEDFFNMEEELCTFVKSLDKFRLIVVKGLRRYGKTSLIHTGLNLAKVDHLFIDCRLLPLTTASFNDFLSIIEAEASRNKKVRELMKDIEHIEIGGLIKFRIRRPETLIKFLESLKDIVIVLDEAQELRRLRFRLDYFLAYALDNLNIRIVVSGSQVGFLHDFLKLRDPRSQLFGRVAVEIDTPHLTEQQAEDYLRKGFKQVGIRPEERLLERTIRELDGIIGWLTYIGVKAVDRGMFTDDILEDALESGAALARQEFENFLEVHHPGRQRYERILEQAARAGRATWKELKRSLEAEEGRRIPDARVSGLLKNLVGGGFLKKNEDGSYSVADPMLSRAFHRG